jgi:hypothetical protein
VVVVVVEGSLSLPLLELDEKYDREPISILLLSLLLLLTIRPCDNESGRTVGTIIHEYRSRNEFALLPFLLLLVLIQLPPRPNDDVRAPFDNNACTSGGVVVLVVVVVRFEMRR